MEKFLESIQSRINLLKNQLHYHPSFEEKYRVGSIIEKLKAALAYLTNDSKTAYEETRFYLEGRFKFLIRSANYMARTSFYSFHFGSISNELSDILDNLKALNGDEDFEDA